MKPPQASFFVIATNTTGHTGEKLYEAVVGWLLSTSAAVMAPKVTNLQVYSTGLGVVEVVIDAVNWGAVQKAISAARTLLNAKSFTILDQRPSEAVDRATEAVPNITNVFVVTLHGDPAEIQKWAEHLGRLGRLPGVTVQRWEP